MNQPSISETDEGKEPLVEPGQKPEIKLWEPFTHTKSADTGDDPFDKAMFPL